MVVDAALQQNFVTLSSDKRAIIDIRDIFNAF
jgi:hypothetical protein